MWTWPAARREPIPRRAARNHALNFVKRMRLDREVLTAYFERRYGAGSSMAELRASQPEARVYRNLFRHQVQRGLYRLRPGSGEMLEAFLYGDTPIVFVKESEFH